MENVKNMYYAKDGFLIFRNSDNFIMGDAVCLGEHDSIDNYEEREVSKEEFDSFFESIGMEKKIK